jgi:hypothetical protein
MANGERRPALIALGVLLSGFGLWLLVLCGYNYVQIANAPTTFATLNTQSRELAIAIVKGANGRRIKLFAPAAALCLVLGVPAIIRGARKTG